MPAVYTEYSETLSPRHGLVAQNLILQHLSRIKRLDMKTSVEIAGIANCQVRDLHGNLLPFVWTRQSVCNEFENATLLTREALQKHLQTFIEAGVKENIELLQKVNDPALLVDWVVRTAEHWEMRYAEKRNEKFDISQTVLSAMFESVLQTAWPMLVDKFELEEFESNLQEQIKSIASSGVPNKYHQYLMQYISEQTNLEERLQETFFWLHRGSHALVRLLYRQELVPGLRDHLCNLAGKMLQKKEVCNKSGAYASHRQRSDVLQEWFYAVRDFQTWIDQTQIDLKKILLELLSDPEWIFFVIDHTAVPVTLMPVKAPVMPFAQQTVICEHCQQKTDSNKRPRAVY